MRILFNLSFLTSLEFLVISFGCICSAQELPQQVRQFGVVHQCTSGELCFISNWICEKTQLKQSNAVIYFPFNKKELQFITANSRDGTTLIWLLTNYRIKVDSFNPSIKSTLTLVEIDCIHDAYRIRQERAFKQWFAEDFDRNEKFPLGYDWNYPVPGDMLYELSKMVCTQEE